MNDLHGILFAYRSNANLGELTRPRNTCSLPFGGRYRLIDFMLSSYVNAGITDVGLVVHESYQSLLDHLGTGKDWDLSRKHGGLRILPPFGYQGKGGGEYRGNMEALAGVAGYLQNIRQDYVIMGWGDIAVNLPVAQVLEQHIASGADLTEVCTAEPGDPSDTYLEMDEQGRIVDVAYDVHTPAGYRCLNVCILRRELLVQLVEECMAHNRYSFRHHILQDQKDRLHLHAYVWQGYAARIDTVQTYYRRSMELLDPAQRRLLFDPQRPILAKENDAPPTYLDPAGVCENAIIADGCDIQGSVKNCILFRGVRVEKGAQVENCVLFKGTVVKKDATLRCVIADKAVTIREGRTLIGDESYPVVVARNATV